MRRRPLSLAYLTNLYPPYVVGGNELFTHDVAEELRRRGHTVHVLTGRGERFPADGFTHQVLDLDLDSMEQVFLGGLPLTLRRLLRWHLFSPAAYRGVNRILRRLQPDLIVAANLYMASAAPLVAARRQACPLIAQPMDKWLVFLLRDVGLIVPGDTPRRRAALRLLRGTLQPVLEALGSPDYLLTVSEFIRRFHIEHGFSAERSRAIYLGVPTERFPFHAHAPPRDRPWRLLFAGQLWEGKGPQVAIDAVHHLRERTELPRVELSLCGTGSGAFIDQLRQQIRRHGLEPHVELRGLVPRDQLTREFREHDVFLFPSIWDEPFSIVLQEAMASGIPIIATTAGGTPEGVEHAQTGLLVPPDDDRALADAVARLMRDPELYRRIAEQAAAHTRRHYAFERFVDRLERIYAAIIDNYEPSRPPLPLQRLLPDG